MSGEFYSPCVGCALCQPACPTFQATREEGASARGKVAILEALAEGRIDPGDPELARQLELCTSCWACESACPAGVATKDIFLDARSLRRPTPKERLLRALLLLAYRSPFLVRTLLPLLFLPLRGARRPARIRGRGTLRHGGMALFAGCMARFAAPDAGEGAGRRMDHLAKAWEATPEGICCGAPLVNNGLAHRLALTAVPLVAWAEALEPREIVTPDATCAESLRDLPRQLPADLAARWAPYAERVTLLQDLDPGFPRTGALQPSCHRLNASGGPPPENLCCGFGGSLLFRDPRLATRIGRRRLAALGAGTVHVEGPGCLAHLRRLLPPGQRGRIRHWTAP